MSSVIGCVHQGCVRNAWKKHEQVLWGKVCKHTSNDQNMLQIRQTLKFGTHRSQNK